MAIYRARVLLTISCSGDGITVSGTYESVDLMEFPDYVPPVPGLEIWLEDPSEDREGNGFRCTVKHPSYSLKYKCLTLVCVREFDGSSEEERREFGESSKFICSNLWRDINEDEDD